MIPLPRMKKRDRPDQTCVFMPDGCRPANDLGRRGHVHVVSTWLSSRSKLTASVRARNGPKPTAGVVSTYPLTK